MADLDSSVASARLDVSVNSSTQRSAGGGLLLSRGARTSSEYGRAAGPGSPGGRGPRRTAPGRGADRPRTGPRESPPQRSIRGGAAPPELGLHTPQPTEDFAPGHSAPPPRGHPGSMRSRGHQRTASALDGSQQSSPPAGGGHRRTGSALDGSQHASPLAGRGHRRTHSDFDPAAVSTASSPGSPTGNESANVRVMVRVRPFSDKEVEEVEKNGGYMQSVVEMPRSDQVLLLDHAQDYSVLQGFHFDQVFWSCSQQTSPVGFAGQRDVYRVTGRQALEAAWEGINSCIFAYGQTGSGKTHTMMGDPACMHLPGVDEESVGLIPRLCKELYDSLAEKDASARHAGIQRSSEVQLRFLEIYNEKVKDLLVSQSSRPDYTQYMLSKTSRKVDPHDLRIREHPLLGPYVEGISTYSPRSYEDMVSLIHAGNQERATAETKLNDRSSRSHAMFRITVTQTTVLPQGEQVGVGTRRSLTSQRQANINLVDLAGSENVKRSGALGTVMTEAQHINLSLTTLRRVIDALIEGRPKGQVPYRESTLTWMLRCDLGGNARTFMLATVSPHHSNQHESLRTLQYAMRARMVVNMLRVNEDETAALVARLERQMEDKAREMNTVGVEERNRLEEEKGQIRAALAELNDRLDRVSVRAEEYKAQLQEESQKRMQEHFQNAALLTHARHRLLRERTGAARLQAEQDGIRRKIEETGHSDLEGLTQSLALHRQKVQELSEESSAVQRREQELLKLQTEMREELRSAVVDRDDTRRQVRDLEDTQRRMTAVHRWQAGALKARMNERCEELIRRNAEHVEMLKAHHDSERNQLVSESETVVREQQAQLQKERAAAHAKLEELQGRMHRHQRRLEDQHAKERRQLQGDVQSRDAQIAQLHQELNAAKREGLQLQQRLDAAEEALRAAQGELSALRHKAQRDADAAVEAREAALAALRLSQQQEREAERERIRGWQRGVLGELELRDAEFQAAREEAARISANVVRLEQRHDDIAAIALALGGGDPPADWTMADVREALRRLIAWRHSYVSVRPNRERLRCFAAPRPQPDPLQQELEREPPLQPAEGGEVLLDGLRCVPHISPQPSPRRFIRSTTVSADAAAAVRTAADLVPYGTEPVLLPPPPASPRPARPQRTARRSRSTPQAPRTYAAGAQHQPQVSSARPLPSAGQAAATPQPLGARESVRRSLSANHPRIAMPPAASSAPPPGARRSSLSADWTRRPARLGRSSSHQQPSPARPRARLTTLGARGYA